MNSEIKKSLPPYFPSRTPTKWVIVIVSLLALAIILDQGVNFFSTNMLQLYNPNLYLIDKPIDPLWEIMIHGQPIIPRAMSSLVYTPFYHFAIGVTTKALVIVVFFLLARKITGNIFAASLAVCFLFGLAFLRLGEYQILNLRFPTGFSSNEFRLPAYLSFRQIGIFFSLVSVLFFLTRRYFLCGLFVGVATHAHSQNSINYFICFCTALMLCYLFKNQKKEYFYGFLIIVVTYLVLIFPFVLKVLGMFKNIEPLDYPTFWNFVVLSEGDDWTITWFLEHKRSAFLAWFLSIVIATFLHLAIKSGIPVQTNNFKTLAKSDEDMVLPLLLAPVVITLFGILWETFLIPYLPDFINDQIFRLNLRRVGTVSSILYMIIFAAFLSQVILVLFEKLKTEILPAKSIERWRQTLKVFKLDSVEIFLALLVASVFLFNVLFISHRDSRFSKMRGIHTFNQYYSFAPIEYDFFRSIGYIQDRPVYKDTLQEVIIPSEPFLDICRWIRNETDIGSAFIHPTYIREFRACSKRQGFLAVKTDGITASADRRFAAIYLKRFLDIHEGLTANDLPELAKNRSKAYGLLRKKYLSISDTRIEQLKQTYPGYGFFLTEVNHQLAFPKLYQNTHFILYDIRGKSS